MEDHGRITITTYTQNGQVCLEITDEGKGISPQVLNNLGTPFLTTKENGTGLGLAVCFRIAAHHRAKIDVTTGVGGTTFFVRFWHTANLA
jgi:two-component system, sporulation sensor kinase E